MTIEELKTKSKVQLDVVQKLIDNKKCAKYQLEKYQTVLRFIKGFVNDLENIKQ